MKEVTSLWAVESSSRDLNSEPLRRGPRARAARCSCGPPDSTDGVLGKRTGFSGATSPLAHGIPGLAHGSKGRRKGDWQEQHLDDQPTNRDPRETAAAFDKKQHQHRSLLVRPFCNAGLRPSLRLAPRPVPCSTPLRGVSRKVSKGGVPPPWPCHTAYPPIGRGCATPPPSHPVRRRSGGRFAREKFEREFQAGDSRGRYSGGRCLSAPLLLPPRFFHPSRGDRGRAVRVEWRVAKMVVV